MSGMRKHHRTEFKAQVARAGIREDATITELSAQFRGQATMIQD